MKILDSDVCIEILRGNVEVIERRRNVDDEVATTWITAAELAYGAEKSRDPERNVTLVTEFLATLPIVGLDQIAALEFGRRKAKLERAGMRVADADLLIAAIALANGASVVTGNRKHYERIEGLRTEDWIRG
ncbi:MAG: type II toxin-antitoxin system VapC family toxin [Thiotrichales bacterium]|nr:type II toxin-antitoxin system VapC family toxin [Thiotrichales bacterium]